MAQSVEGELYYSLTGQLFELARQLRQPNGYPYDVERLKTHLQAGIEGHFGVTNHFHETREFMIDFPALKRPTLKEVQERFPHVRSIVRDTSPEGPLTMRLSTILHYGEEPIDGQEYERRLAPMRDAMLGFQHMRYLLEYRLAYSAFRASGNIFIHFRGIVLESEELDLVVPMCNEYDSSEGGRLFPLKIGFDHFGRIAIGSKYYPMPRQ